MCVALRRCAACAAASVQLAPPCITVQLTAKPQVLLRALAAVGKGPGALPNELMAVSPHLSIAASGERYRLASAASLASLPRTQYCAVVANGKRSASARGRVVSDFYRVPVPSANPEGEEPVVWFGVSRGFVAATDMHGAVQPYIALSWLEALPPPSQAMQRYPYVRFENPGAVPDVVHADCVEEVVLLMPDVCIAQHTLAARRFYVARL